MESAGSKITVPGGLGSERSYRFLSEINRYYVLQSQHIISVSADLNCNQKYSVGYVCSLTSGVSDYKLERLFYFKVIFTSYW